MFHLQPASKLRATSHFARRFEIARTIAIARLPVLALVAALIGCTPAVESPTGAISEQKSDSPSAKDAGAPGARFTVEVKGGDHIGTYHLDSFDPQPCQIGMTGVNVFSVNASGKPPSLTYAEAFISDFQAGGGGTEAFGFAAKTADFEIRVDRMPNALQPGGRGTATYTDDGANNIEIKISGESKDGIPFDAIVDCSRVGR